MKIIVIASPKGGTGKSTTAYALAAELAKRGHRVLGVDADVQGGFSELSGDCDGMAKHTLGDFLWSEIKYTEENTFKANGGFSLIPMHYTNDWKSYDAVDAMRMKEMLQAFDPFFDYCIVDTSPSDMMFKEWGRCVLSLAHKVIIPVRATPFDLQALKMFAPVLEDVKKKNNPDLVLEGLLLTMCDFDSERLPYFVKDLRETAELMNTKVFFNAISEDGKIRKAAFEKENFMLQDIMCDAAVQYRRFVNELLAFE